MNKLRKATKKKVGNKNLKKCINIQHKEKDKQLKYAHEQLEQNQTRKKTIEQINKVVGKVRAEN